MKKALLALVFGSALFLAACGGGDEATDKDTNTNKDNTEETTNNNNNGTSGDTATNTDNGSVAEGQAVVQKACINCHGANLEGRGSFPALADVGSRLSEEEILNIILNGKGGMPAGAAKGADAESAAAYLSTLK